MVRVGGSRRGAERGARGDRDGRERRSQRRSRGRRGEIVIGTNVGTNECERRRSVRMMMIDDSSDPFGGGCGDGRRERR